MFLLIVQGFFDCEVSFSTFHVVFLDEVIILH